MFGHFVVVVLGKVKEIISFIQLLFFWDILRVSKSLTITTKAENTLHYRGSTRNQPCFINIPSSPLGLSSKISLARLLGSQYPVCLSTNCTRMKHFVTLSNAEY